MLDIKVLINIKKSAINSLNSDSSGELWSKTKNQLYFLFTFTIIPLLISGLAFYFDVRLESFENYIISGISIFTGLFFSLLLNISSKIRIEKENKNLDIENFKAFKENMKQIADITQYVIIIGVEIMILTLINILVSSRSVYIDFTLTCSVIFLIARYFLCLLSMLQRFYFVTRDEIKNIM